LIICGLSSENLGCENAKRSHTLALSQRERRGLHKRKKLGSCQPNQERGERVSVSELGFHGF